MARSKSTDTSAPGGKAGRSPGASGRGRAAGGGKGATASAKGGGRGSGAAGKAAKEKKEGRLKRFGNQLRLIKQAYSITRQNDPKLPWILLATFLGVGVVVELIAIFVLHSPYLFLLFAILFGVLAALIVFGRRAQSSAFRQAEGQPGAAAWALENMRGNWQVTAGVAGTPQLDAVHRVLGRPGIVLVGEGAPSRVRGLLAQEKKRVARVVGDTPIYDVVVGDGEGQVPLKKLSNHLTKLPRNISAAEVNALSRRMSALGGARMPVPGGPLPGGRQMSVSQRQVRRR